jgi:Chaperone of endosialidase
MDSYNFRLTGSAPSVLVDESTLTFLLDRGLSAVAANVSFQHGSNTPPMLELSSTRGGPTLLSAPEAMVLRAGGTDAMRVTGSGGVSAHVPLAAEATLDVTGAASFDAPVTARNDLNVYGVLNALGEAATACNLTVNGSVSLGAGVSMTYDGSNLGINLPPGTRPKCTLHVNGVVCANEEVFALSDRTVKTDIRGIDGALDKVRLINGCTYRRIGDDSGLRHLGVIAQDVHAAVPEAVHLDTDGRMSVAYGNLSALLVEAVKELSEQRDRDRQLIEQLRAQIGAAASASSPSSRHPASPPPPQPPDPRRPLPPPPPPPGRSDEE